MLNYATYQSMFFHYGIPFGQVLIYTFKCETPVNLYEENVGQVKILTAE